jgi:uncharacterized protein with NAD-binding domain and iron-sulfur cluster
MPAKKIAILGGGVAGLTTAFMLTDTPEKRAAHDVTIYQMGWRLGGKCASGRGPNGRIEEHGIHLFGGGYYNALAMVSKCYDELNTDQRGWSRTFDAAFERQYFTLFWDGPAGARIRNQADLPGNPLAPGDGNRFRTIVGMVGGLIDTVQKLITRDFEPGGAFAILPNPFAGILGTGFPVDSLMSLVDGFRREIASPGGSAGTALTILGDLADWIGDYCNPDSLAFALLPEPVLTRLRIAYAFANFALGLTRGVVSDLLIAGKTFDVLDEQETGFADWLRRHGVREETLGMSFVQAPLGILYAYPSGDPTKPDMGAGAYLHWNLRTFAYLGAPFWFFDGGTGEILIAPLYEALRRRGVKFEFFRKVERLALSGDKSAVAAVHMQVQVTPKTAPYQPLMTVGDLACWPSEPLYDQLKEGATLRASGANLESYWSDWQPAGTQVLNVGVDFDVLVFAISLGAVPHLCGELLAHKPEWRQMVEHIPTLQTQSLQIWMNRTSNQLGAAVHPIHQDTALACGFAKPFDGIVDFSPLIRLETWPDSNKPKALWYFSDILPDAGEPPPPFNDTGYPARRQRQVRSNALRFLDSHIGRLLPAATRADGGFDFGRLALQDTVTELRGQARIDHQYVRANIDPAERYVTSPARTTKYRLKAGNTGFSNLVIAGDWAYTGLNVGCVEATVMSGKLASHAICADPPIDEIIGYNPPTR